METETFVILLTLAVMTIATGWYAAQGAMLFGRSALRRARSRCVSCGYPSHSLPSPRCPECGKSARAVNAD